MAITVYHCCCIIVCYFSDNGSVDHVLALMQNYFLSLLSVSQTLPQNKLYVRWNQTSVVHFTVTLN